MAKPEISGEIEPLVDVLQIRRLKLWEMSGLEKQKMKVNTYSSSVAITNTGVTKRKYRCIVYLPADADVETAKSTSNNGNGILKIKFAKRKLIKVDQSADNPISTL